jgi:ActR/RegA family two-component response regulator/AraC-like DNA-binding protein
MLAGVSRHRPNDARRVRRVASTRDHHRESSSILCVDDNASMLHVLRRLLGREGWRVETAASSKEALIKARGTAFDALVVDLKLSDGSGLEVLKTLRREGIDTPAILLTGFPSVSSAIEATKLGVGYLLKRDSNDRTIVAAVRTLLTPMRRTAVQELSPVQRAIRQLIETTSSERVPKSINEASRTFASLLCERELTFRSFVIAASVLRALVDPGTAPGHLVPFLREHALKSLEQPDASADALLARLLQNVETAGKGWASVEKDAVAQSVQCDVTTREKLLGGMGLSWSQFRRAVVMRRAIASLANGDDYISQIAYALGYDHPTAFDRDFHLLLGIPPTAYRLLTRTGA